MTNATAIQSYHAHLYFDAATVENARAVADAAEARFDLEKGRLHEKPVGPHPMWSLQLACSPIVFADLLPWLALNRAGLIVFCHPNTGDALADHRDHAIWLGGCLELNLDILR